MTDRTYPDPVAETARAIYEGRNGARAIPWSHREWSHKEPYMMDAEAALARLRALGMLGPLYYEAREAMERE